VKYKSLKTRVIDLARSLNSLIFKDDNRSILIEAKYRFDPPPLSQDKKRKREENERQKLREDRDKLKENGVDPLPAALELARQAKSPRRAEGSQESDDDQPPTSPRAPPTPKMSNATLDIWDDDVEDDDDDDNQGSTPNAVRRMASPKSVKVVAMLQRQTFEADEGIFDEDGKVIKRRRWTEDEDNALKRGVEIFGAGNWKAIKERFSTVLCNRQTVQMKDRFRTLLRNHQVAVPEVADV
jgi:hypothetical protein